MPDIPEEPQDPSRERARRTQSQGTPNVIDDLREGNVPTWLRTAAAAGWRILVVAGVVVGAAFEA